MDIKQSDNKKDLYDQYDIPDYNKIDYDNDDKSVQEAKIKAINEQIKFEEKKTK